MLSANSTMYKKIKLSLLLGTFATGIAQAQTENSPYSRYGLGDQLPSQNILTRALGGVSAAYSDILTVNFTNPSSYARLKRATLDFGLEIDSRTLRVTDPPAKFNSVSPIISYVQLGLPLSQKKNWGMNIGLRPINRINYKLEKNERLPGIDSVNTLFEGNGGTYEVYTGTGFDIIKNLSVGFNVGYLFGSKDYSSSRSFIADSSNVFYYPGKQTNNTSYGGISGNAGLQYTIKTSKKSMLRLGAYGSIKRNIRATSDERVETYSTNANGTDSIDVVKNETISGKISYPATTGFGFVYHGSDRWLVGADYSQTRWSQYKYFGQNDLVQDSWTLHFGGQYLPDFVSAKSYWGRVTYRAGLSFGKDYVKADGDLPVWTGSLGLGLPMRPPSYSNQYSMINMTIEFGRRGNNSNIIRENFFRLAMGLTLSDIWFVKRKYD